MLISPVVSALLKALVAWRPGLLALTLEKVVCDTLRTVSGTTMCAPGARGVEAPGKLPEFGQSELAR